MTAAVAEARPVRATSVAPASPRPPDPLPSAIPPKVTAPAPRPEATPSKPSPINDDEHYEIIDGRRVETSWMGTVAADIASGLSRLMGNHVHERRLGRVHVEGYFELEPDTQRCRPDIAYVSFQRWPGPLPQVAWWPVVPDLAVEVASPNDLVSDVMAKMFRYLRLGVRAVWLVLPEHAVVEEWTGPKSIRVFHWDDVLDGGEVLPGFAVKVSDFCSEPVPDTPMSEPAAG